MLIPGASWLRIIGPGVEFTTRRPAPSMEDIRSENISEAYSIGQAVLAVSSDISLQIITRLPRPKATPSHRIMMYSIAATCIITKQARHAAKQSQHMSDWTRRTQERNNFYRHAVTPPSLFFKHQYIPSPRVKRSIALSKVRDDFVSMCFVAAFNMPDGTIVWLG